jgi:hypothetical protein
MAEGPPPIERMRKVGEPYEDPQTGPTGHVYDPPRVGEDLMRDSETLTYWRSSLWSQTSTARGCSTPMITRRD